MKTSLYFRALIFFDENKGLIVLEPFISTERLKHCSMQQVTSFPIPMRPLLFCQKINALKLKVKCDHLNASFFIFNVLDPNLYPYVFRPLLIFLLVSWKPLTKRAWSGTGSGSVIQCTDPRNPIRIKMSQIRNLNMFLSHPLPTSLYLDSALTHLCFRSLDLEVAPAKYRDSSNVLFCTLKRFFIVISQDWEKKTLHDCPVSKVSPWIQMLTCLPINSVNIASKFMQCCGSGIRCRFYPRSEIWNRFFLDPESRIPDPKPIFLIA